jgi:hypothetical protein
LYREPTGAGGREPMAKDIDVERLLARVQGSEICDCSITRAFSEGRLSCILGRESVARISSEF